MIRFGVQVVKWVMEKGDWRLNVSGKVVSRSDKNGFVSNVCMMKLLTGRV